MICIIALIVFAILAIFSAKYRPLAAEAFDCVFRRVTFRKCNSSLDKRLKSQITGKVLKHHKSLGRFVFKYFEILSWTFLILSVLSVVQIGVSIHNYLEYGNCNGPGETGFCPFDPLGHNNPTVSESDLCVDPDLMKGTLMAPNLEAISSNPRTGSAQAAVTVIEFGCFACPNTAKQAPDIRQMIEYYGTDIQFIYVDFPLPTHNFSTEAAIAAQCVYDQDAMTYWKYYFTIFDQQALLSPEQLRLWAQDLDIDLDRYDACLLDETSSEQVEEDVAMGMASGIYGTPTFFINGESHVGYQNFKALRAYINDALSVS